MPETITLNIKDAFSGQVYPGVKFQRELTVWDAINGLANELGLPLVDENMNERTFALKKAASDTILQNDQVLSSGVEAGETLEFYEEVKTEEIISLAIKDELSGITYLGFDVHPGWTAGKVTDIIPGKIGLSITDENGQTRAFAIKLVDSNIKLEPGQILSEVVREGDTLVFFEETVSSKNHRDF